MKLSTNRITLSMIVILTLSGCAMAPVAVQDRALMTDGTESTQPAPSGHDRSESGDESAGPALSSQEPTIILGSGSFVQAARSGQADAIASEDGVTLNFEQADLKEFLRVVFETILRENYYVDPQTRGTVTLHTTRPVTESAVLPIVETVLEGNGAALIRDDGMYKIVPLAIAESASGSPAIGRFGSGRAVGYGIQVVPLEHVSASEIQKIIGPFVPDGSSLRIDETRNVLILSGPRYRLEELLATIRTFDVDWLSGMSFGLFRLQYADAASMVSELDAIVGAGGQSPLSGIVRLLPIERLNAVLVIAHRPDHISGIQGLIEEFDWGVEGAAGRRLYVYELENGDATKIASSLQSIFMQSMDERFADNTSRISGSDVFRSAAEIARPVTMAAGGPIDDTDGAAADFGDGVVADGMGEVKIIADDDNNAILVLASQQDYRSIEAAIKRLDIAPRQVLIEATIAEVSLSNTLTHGVRWFLENGGNEIGINAPVPTNASGAGLAFAFFDRDRDLSAFFDLLATQSSVKFLSTPQVMVLDNQTATIRVGDQIPVTTRSSQSTANPDAPIVTEVQFRDTGTILTVTPRINSGGQVMLEINQEVSLPGTEPAVGGGGNVSIAQRSISSSVIVQSGQSVVLGGLILETTSDGKSGVPGLMNVPVFGKLFTQESEDVFRTELIVTVSPKVVENQQEMRQVTDELRRRMQKASEYQESIDLTGSGT
jgi:general secretion pathway protein D